MAWATFGSSVDVLVGGEDLTFPHHAYQAAMVEAAAGVTPFARRMITWGTVCDDGVKMAKSTRNLVLVSDLLEQAPGAAVRLMLLDRRWRVLGTTSRARFVTPPGCWRISMSPAAPATAAGAETRVPPAT